MICKNNENAQRESESENKIEFSDDFLIHFDCVSYFRDKIQIPKKFTDFNFYNLNGLLILLFFNKYIFDFKVVVFSIFYLIMEQFMKLQ
jgi:hypothetical protein